MMREASLILLLPCLFLLTLEGSAAAPQATDRSSNRSFVIDYENNQFLKDGEPFRYISGSIHYYRVHPTDWADRLRKMRMAGFNAVQTYIEWSSHEAEPGKYDFNGTLDLEAFITTAQKEDLLVILRPGPYICAERDMGGLPFWLLNKNPNMQLRSSDPSFLEYVDKWLGSELLPRLKPLLYENGGPIIMIQVENEYGSSAECDFAYTSHLRDLTRAVLGDGVVLFTTDGGSVGYLKCGKIADVYSTVDFGAGDPAPEFEAQRLFEPRGPLVNSEFYSGWLDHWGEPHSTVDSQTVATSLDRILAMNASVNMYMFHGGTNFGVGSGANMGDHFQPCPTSYDYDSPLTEAGDPTEKYWAIRNVTKKYLPLPAGDVPPASEKTAYGRVQLSSMLSLHQMMHGIKPVASKYPLTFEALGAPTGLVIYRTNFTFRINDPARIAFTEVHDRGYVFANFTYIGTVDREQQLYELPISAEPNTTLTIFVESQGHIGYGPHINDFKGLTTNVTLNGHTLENWFMVTIPMTNASRMAEALADEDTIIRPTIHGPFGNRMLFYKGNFEVPATGTHPHDTFLRLDGWKKGVVWVNNFMLGRYWPEVGPQVTLYVPHGVLKQGDNTLVVLEYEAAPCNIANTCFVTFTDTHILNGPTPS